MLWRALPKAGADFLGALMAKFNRIDLEHILRQILMAEAGQPPLNPHLAFGLRQVDGRNNNSVPGNTDFGAADRLFPRVGTQFLQQADMSPAAFGPPVQTSYSQTGGLVFDADPRIITNLISDQTANNPAALAAQAAAGLGDGYLNQVPNPDFDPGQPVDPILNPQFLPGHVGTPISVDASGNLFITNVTPDAGLSAPFNSWFTFFGQFFDHGLDLVTKGGNGTVLIPLMPDDPLILVGPDGIAGTGDELTDPNLQFMAMTRVTQFDRQPGLDGILGNEDDTFEAENTTTPFVDQNQTYSSHPSHQVFLREYGIGADGAVRATGSLITGTDGHSMATWADVKAQASAMLGIQLLDTDVGNVPLLRTDAYGKFIPNDDPLLGPVGFAQIITGAGVDGIFNTADDAVVVGDPAANGGLGVLLPNNAVRTGHAFLNDIAHDAAPGTFDHDHNPATPPVQKVADGDTVAGPIANPDFIPTDPISPTNRPFLAQPVGTYDDELLDSHYMAGDGRVNENIGLIAVHELFHSEHNRQVEMLKAQILAELANGDTGFALAWVLPGADLSDLIINDNEWNGERLFQAAKFATEVQYQHIVFEEFARKVQPNIHAFGNNAIELDPAITAEFAHAVYRFGHSMLDENVDRYVLHDNFLADGVTPNPLAGTPVMDADGRPVLNAVGLIEAFLNPLMFDAQGSDAAAEIILGSVNQIGNEIDEFVTGALRNNLVGLPLDLAAINIARGRDAGVPTLNLLRNQIYTALNTGGTANTELRPYASWNEFGQFLKHAESLVNFIAAYGTHSTIIAAGTDLSDRRAAAQTLLDNSVVGSAGFTQDAFNFVYSLGAYANNVNDIRAVHDAAGLAPQWSTGSVTGLDQIDLWIGGLAEKQNLFGGLLGSTFNFIFETQMEAIQDGDRLYYLPRVEGMEFGLEVENGSFAELIMANTNARHLSASIFLTPEYVVEATNYFQRDAAGNFVLDINGDRIATDSSTWLRNPVSGALLVEVLADGTVHFIGDDNFFGNTMVLGGTPGDDRLQAGQADDDTVWGDSGNDWIDGGNGNDFLYGGDGNDTIQDSSGDDIIHAGAGNDTVDGGSGDDIIFGNEGDDLLHGGNSIVFGDSISGGAGNDLIFGDEGDDALMGNEGDDWISGGVGGDGIVGDVGAPTGQVPLYAGNDVLDGGAEGDKMTGFSGDDIMLGEGGFDKFIGKLGFDWASYENSPDGVSVDMDRREFIPDQQIPAGDAVRDFFVETEATSGSAHDDYIKGSTDIVIVDPVTGARLGGAGSVSNELTNVDLISGLADFFPIGTPVFFNTGNILLGGDGSDRIEGRSGDDILDGDAFLHVDLTRDAQGNIFAGSQIIREIHYDLTDGDVDTAVFSDVLANYIINPIADAQGFYTITQVAVTPGIGLPPGGDGVDRVRNIERLQFSDQTVSFATLLGAPDPNENQVPTGTLTIDNNAPAVGDVLTLTSTLADNDQMGVGLIDNFNDNTVAAGGDGIVDGSLHYQWQYQEVAAGGTVAWVDLEGATASTFTVSSFVLGFPLRVRAFFTDGLGFTEHAWSALTAVVTENAAVNTAPFILQQQNPPGLLDTTARTNTALNIVLPLNSVFADNQTLTNNLIFTAALASSGQLLDGSAAANFLTFSTQVDAAGVIFGLITGQFDNADIGAISIRVTATDEGIPAPALSITDTFTINVLRGNAAPIAGAFAAQSLQEGDGVNGGLDTFVGAVTGFDPDGSSVAFRLVAASVFGGTVTAFNQTTGAFTFVANGDEFVGATLPAGAGFNFTVFDGQTNSAPGEVRFDLQATDDGQAPISITGTAALGGTLSALIGVDPDGEWNPGVATYQWFRNGVAVGGVNVGNPDYLVGAGDVGQRLSVRVTYTDAQEFSYDFTTPQLAPIGTLTVRGVTANAPIITAFSTIVDPDGDLGPEASFKIWQVSNNVGGPFLDVPALGADVDANGDLVLPQNSVRFVRLTLQSVDALGFLNEVTADVVRVAVGIDTQLGTGDNNNLNSAFAGTDILIGLGGNDVLSGNGGNDNLFGGDGNDTLNGGAGNDVLWGGLGSDTVNGGAGNDTILYTVGDSVDAVNGNGDNDRLEILGTGGNNTLDVVFAGGSLTSFGGGGTIANVESLTADLLDGVDTLTYDPTGGAITLANINVNLGLGTASGFASVLGIENVVGGSGNDSFIGSDDNNVLSGGNGNDSLNGGAGNDTLNGDGGTDTLTGGAGNDALNGGGGTDAAVFSGPVANYDFALVGGNVQVIDASAGSPNGVDTLNNIETFRFGAQSLNLVAGTNANNNGVGSLNGGNNADIVLGFNGTDTLNGNGGADVLVGGAGTDTMNGGAGNDTFVFGAGFGTDTITAGFDADAGGGQDVLALASSLGINAANFAAHVTITDLGADTLVTIDGVSTITLIGVNGVGNNVITIDDFIFGG